MSPLVLPSPPVNIQVRISSTGHTHLATGVSVSLAGSVVVTSWTSGGAAASVAEATPAPARRRPRRRPKEDVAWRGRTDEVVDAVTLEPLAEGAVAARCARCGAAYGRDSVATLISRHRRRCLLCRSRRLETVHPQDGR